MPDDSSKGFPFLLKLLVIAYVASCLLLLLCGEPLWKVIGASAFIAPLLVIVWSMAAAFLGDRLTAVCRRPALRWYLHKLMKELTSTSSTAPAIGGDHVRSWIATVHREAFVQLSLVPTPEGSQENHFFPSFEPRAKCRLMIARDGASYWELSHNGRFDLTCEESRDWYLGDDAFDEVVRMIGALPAALAVLTPGRRKALLALLGDRWHLANLQCKPPIIQITPAGKFLEPQPLLLPSLTLIRQTLDGLVAFLGGLTIAPEEIAPALLANAATDPMGAVRRRNLEALASLKPEREQLDQAITLARRDEDPSVRVWAAKMVGGDSGLAELGAVAQNPVLGFALRMEAIDYLLRNYPAGPVWSTLEAAIRLCSPTGRPAVLDAMLATRDPALLLLFADFLKRWDPEAAVEAINHLGRYGHPIVEEALLNVLTDEELTVRLAALQALGEVGTKDVLPPLVDLTSEVHLCRAAETAIRKIQAREHVGDAGQLSLAEPDTQAGAVSLVDPAGALELVGKREDEA